MSSAEESMLSGIKHLYGVRKEGQNADEIQKPNLLKGEKSKKTFNA